MRQHASPAPIAPYKNIRGPFPRAEFFSHKLSVRAGYRGNHGDIAVNAHPEISRLHRVMGQRARFDHLEKARPINYFSVGVNDDPVIRGNSSEAFEVVFNDCLRERLFQFQNFIFHINS